MCIRDRSGAINIEEVSDEEIRISWENSGVKQKEIADHFGVEIPTVSRWLAGQLSDKRKRYDLICYLRMRGVA